MVDRLADFGETRDLSRHVGGESQLAHIEKGFRQSGRQVLRAVGLRQRPRGLAIGLTNDLPHLEAAAKEQKWRQLAIVLAAAVVVETWGTPHLAGDDEQNSILQAALAHVVDKSTDGVIDLAAHPVDTRHLFGTVTVGVVVPAAVGNGYKAAP